MSLKLNNREIEALTELIERRLTELKVEIHRTERVSYRQELERDYEILSALKDRMLGVSV